MKVSHSITTFHQQLSIPWMDRIKASLGFKFLGWDTIRARVAAEININRTVRDNNIPPEITEEPFKHAQVFLKEEKDPHTIERESQALINKLIKSTRLKTAEKRWSDLKNSIPSHIYLRHPASIQWIENIFKETIQSHDHDMGDKMATVSLLEGSITAFQNKLELEGSVLNDAEKVYNFVKNHANTLKSDEKGRKLADLAQKLLSYQYKLEHAEGLPQPNITNTPPVSIGRLTELKKPNINEMFWNLQLIEKFCKENDIHLPLRVGTLPTDRFMRKDFYD